MDFRQVWQTVERLAGQSFTADRGEEFHFVFKKTFVVVSPGGVSIPRTNFEKVFKNPSSEAVQGGRFIKAIYRHPAFELVEF